MALYIAFEGGEGSGKSTQARLLADKIDGEFTREPGGTALGAQLRQLLLGVAEAPVGARAETLMMAADRAQHMTELVAPTLARGRHVVSDRSAYSSLAYQGGGRELGVSAVRAVNDWALDGLWPDLVIYLDCPPKISAGRLSRELDRLEAEDVAFHDRVRTTFAELAAADSHVWATVDADDTIEGVEAKVWSIVQARLSETS